MRLPDRCVPFGGELGKWYLAHDCLHQFSDMGAYVVGSP